MKLSERTVKILRNFSEIHSNLLVRPGKVLSITTPNKRILAWAAVTEEFPTQFAIYDLGKFISVVSLFKEPEITFGTNQVTIADGVRRVDYTYSAETSVTPPPEKKLTLPQIAATFPLPAKVLADLFKAAGVLGLSEVAMSGRDGKIFIELVNVAKPTSDSYSAEVGTTDQKFRLIFKLDNFKFLPGDYVVELSKVKYAHIGSGDTLDYWIPAEDTSEFL